MTTHGPDAKDLAYLGGVAAASMCKLVAMGLHDEAEELWLNQQMHDGGRALCAGLTNVAVQAVVDLLSVEADRRAATGQAGDPPSLMEVFDSISSRYAFAFQADLDIRNLTKETDQ